MSALRLPATIACTSIALLLFLSPPLRAEPITYVPDLHPTYREEVPTRRRLARGAEDPLTKAASKALGIDLDFCIRLRRNMRREVMVAPESDPGPRNDFYSAGKAFLLNEMRLHGSVNRSARRGTSIIYRHAGQPVFLGLTASGGVAADEPPPTLVTFSKDAHGKAVILDQEPSEFYFWSDCFITDMTGDGKIDVAVVGNPGVSGGGGVSCFTILADGKIKENGFLKSAYGVASLVDLNRDGVWEIETSQFLAYEGGSGSYQFNCLSAYNAGEGRWRLTTDHYPISFRRQSRFYRAFKPALAGFERITDAASAPQEVFRYRGKDYRLSNISFGAVEVGKLLQSWDAYSAERQYESY